MRIRPVWVAVPACAAAGAVTISFVAAQEPPPAGYYQGKVSPPPPDIVAQQRYIRPMTGAGTARSADPSGPPAWAGSPQRGRLTDPVAVGPTPGQPAPPRPLPLQQEPIRQAAAFEPVLPPPKFFPDVTPPKSDPPKGLVAPTATPLPPPKIIESADPKPLPLVPPQPTVPHPTAVGPVAPTLPPAGPEAKAEKAEPPPGSRVPPLPAPAAAFPPGIALAPQAAPRVVLETIAPESVGVGQNLSYELVVRNAGSAAVANVRVEDELPAGAKLIASEPPAEQAGDRLAWSVGPLDAGAEKRLKITVRPADEGEVRSRAVVSFSAAAEARVKVTRPRVGVALTAVESARVGDEVVFQLKVSNTGSGAAGRVLIQARLSDGLHRPEGGVIEAELKDLPAGETKPVTLRVLATKAGPQQCSITATADANPAETAKAAVSVVEPLLQAKVAGPAKCLVRSEPEFKVELANPGSAATDPVQVWVVVPEGFEFLHAAEGGTYQPANRTVVWRLPGLPAGSTRAIPLKLRAAGPADGVLRAVAQAAPAGGDVTPAGGVAGGGRAGRVLEAKADAPLKAEGVPALRFEVTDIEDPVEVGKEAMYEIKVMNQGTGPCTNVQVTAALADGTIVTGATGPTQGRGVGQQVAFDPLPQLATKGEAMFRVRVKGTQAGDQKLRVQVVCDQIRTPIVKEENTRFYKD